MNGKLERTQTPGIYKRGSRYVVVFRDQRGRQRKRFAKTIAEAKRQKAGGITDVARGEYQERSKETFASYARRWIVDYEGRTDRGVLPQTRSGYEERLEEAINYFGRMRLVDIEPQHIKAYMRTVAARIATRGPNKGKPVSKNTVRLALAPVKAMFADAREDGVIRHDPASGVRLPKTQAKGAGREKAMTANELGRLLAKLPAEWRLFFSFLAHTGLRIGEAIELRWSDVDLGESRLSVERRYYRGDVGAPKTSNGLRPIRLTAAMTRDLWQLRKETRAGDDELVFTSEKRRRIQPSNLTSRVLKPALRRAGLDERLSFHNFRHTNGSLMYDEGYTDEQVQHWLGHAKASFTKDVYIHPVGAETPAPEFMDGITVGGNLGATRATETSRDSETPLEAVSAS